MLDEAREAYGPETWDAADKETAVSELVFGDG
jgi:hypothetical protein